MDNRREWYTRAMSGDAQKSVPGIERSHTSHGVKKKRNKPPSWIKRNKRQGIKNKRKKRGEIPESRENFLKKKRAAPQNTLKKKRSKTD